MAQRFLVFFKTMIEGGWRPVEVNAVAIVEDTEGNMPYGWNPDEIHGVYCYGIDYIIPLNGTDSMPISGEYDKDIVLKEGEAFLVRDESFPDRTADDTGHDDETLPG